MSPTKQELLQSILNDVADLQFETSNLVPKIMAYERKIGNVQNRAIIIAKSIFGEESNYVKAIRKVAFTPTYFTGPNDPVWDKLSFDSGKAELTDLIMLMVEDIKLSNIFRQQSDSYNTNNISSSMPSNKVFIVHGHNEEMKHSTARFLDKIKWDPIILHEQANQGKTIIEKFTSHSDVAFAVVLLSADDIGTTKVGDFKKAKFRARQNVIFELGFFLGKLGRERVFVLHQVIENFEFPSDYQGVIYIPFDSNGHWRFDIIKEMKAIGYEVDANDIL